MPWPRRGSFTSLQARRDRLPDRGQNLFLPRHVRPLEHGRERRRRELRADALDRRVEPVERLLLDDGRHLGAEAHPRDGLVRDDEPVRLLDGGDDRLLVEGLERPRVDDLDRDAVLLGLVGGLQRLVHERTGRHDRDIRPLAEGARLAERDRLDRVGHVLLACRRAAGARRRSPCCRRRSTSRSGRAHQLGVDGIHDLSPGMPTNQPSTCWPCWPAGFQPAPPWVRTVSGTFTWPPDM